MPPRKKKRKNRDGDVIEEIVDRLMDHPRTQTVLDQATAYFDDFGVIIDRVARRVITQDAERERRYQRLLSELKASRARAATFKPPKECPREVLGFSPAEKLTVEIVKKRQRDLVKIFHPDRGGNTAAMQRYNAAASELLKQLGG